MPDLNDWMKSKQAAGLLADQGKLEKLRDAPETQRLFSMLSRSAGGDLEQAAGRAAQGDAGQLTAAIQQLMRDPEGARLIERLKQSLK